MAKRTINADKMSSRQGFVYGLKLLGQVSGILLVSGLVGWGLDSWFDSEPYALAGSVIAGSIAATILVVVEAYRILK